MEARKAALRSLMKEATQKRGKKLEHPLVRYNEYGQVVCKLCNTVVKAESLWEAHVGSKQHNESIARLKARAKAQEGAGQSGARALAGAVGSGTSSAEVAAAGTNGSRGGAGPAGAASPDSGRLSGLVRPASSLPDGFFDTPQAKLSRTREGAAPASTQAPSPAPRRPSSPTRLSLPPRPPASTARPPSQSQPPQAKQRAQPPAPQAGATSTAPASTSATPAPSPAGPAPSLTLPADFFDAGVRQAALAEGLAAGGTDAELASSGAMSAGVADVGRAGEGGALAGDGGREALPKGFFDDKAKDAKARGEEYKKPDLRDEMKEFKKSIQVDLAEEEVRQAAEEADAADEREQREELTRRAFVEHLAELRKKKDQQIVEARARAAREGSNNRGQLKIDLGSDGEEDEDEEEDVLLDWRAKMS